METSQSTISSTVYGFPRIGNMRQLKRATESYWAGKISAEDLMEVGAAMRADAWSTMRLLESKRFQATLFFLRPHARHGSAAGRNPRASSSHQGEPIDRYFAMARGNDEVSPLEMTKWFDTNYHYLVPELSPETNFRIASKSRLKNLLRPNS